MRCCISTCNKEIVHCTATPEKEQFFCKTNPSQPAKNNFQPLMMLLLCPWFNPTAPVLPRKRKVVSPSWLPRYAFGDPISASREFDIEKERRKIGHLFIRKDRRVERTNLTSKIDFTKINFFILTYVPMANLRVKSIFQKSWL